MSLPIILLCGESGCGKSTVGKLLIERYGGEGFAIADPMKIICKNLFGFDDTALWGPSEERNRVKPIDKVRPESKESVYLFFKKVSSNHPDIAEYFIKWIDLIDLTIRENGGLSARMALQSLDSAKNLDRNIWINYAIKQAVGLLEEGKSFVVLTDGRFCNEVVQILKVGGKPVLIERPRNPSTTPKKHISEQAIAKVPRNWFYCRIYNNSTEDNLAKKADSLASLLSLDLEPTYL